VPATRLLHVTVEPHLRVRLAGLVVHRSRLPADQRGPPGAWGLPLTDAEPTVVDCLRVLPVDAARSLVFAAVQRRLVTLKLLTARAALLAGSPGLRAVRARLGELVSGAHSVGEWRPHVVLTAAGIGGWVANQPIMRGDRVLLVPDVRFLDVPLIIEFDGRAYHEAQRAWGRRLPAGPAVRPAGPDRAPGDLDQVVHRPDEVVAAVRQALGRLGRVG